MRSTRRPAFLATYRACAASLLHCNRAAASALQLSSMLHYAAASAYSVAIVENTGISRTAAASIYLLRLSLATINEISVSVIIGRPIYILHSPTWRGKNI